MGNLAKIAGKIGIAIIKTTALVVITTFTGQMLKSSSFDVGERIIQGSRVVKNMLRKNEG